MSNKIRLDVDIINIRFKYLNTDTISDVKYSDSRRDLNHSKQIQSRILPSSKILGESNFSKFDQIFIIK